MIIPNDISIRCFPDNFGCIYASRLKKVELKMPVLDVFMTANSSLLSNIHPTKIVDKYKSTIFLPVVKTATSLPEM